MKYVISAFVSPSLVFDTVEAALREAEARAKSFKVEVLVGALVASATPDGVIAVCEEAATPQGEPPQGEPPQGEPPQGEPPQGAT